MFICRRVSGESECSGECMITEKEACLAIEKGLELKNDKGDYLYSPTSDPFNVFLEEKGKTTEPVRFDHPPSIYINDFNKISCPDCDDEGFDDDFDAVDEDGSVCSLCGKPPQSFSALHVIQQIEKAGFKLKVKTILDAEPYYKLTKNQRNYLQRHKKELIDYLQSLQNHEIEEKAYAIFNAIEPALKQAIAEALK